MKARFPLFTLITVAVALGTYSGCGGGGGGSKPTPTPITPIPAPLSITTTKIPNGVVGKPYSATVQASGGSGTRTWKVSGGPAWLTIDATTGELKCTAPERWWGTVSIQVQDSAAQTATASLWFAISPVLQIVPPPGGTRGLDYKGTISTQGGMPPAQKLSITGSLPPGLAIQLTDWGTGEITGTPTETGSFTFTVQTTDVADPPQTAKSDVTMVIDTHIGITTKGLKYGVEGRSYSDMTQVVNGTAPFTWSVDSLPRGLGINPSTGEISGTPTMAGSWTANITVKDSSTPQQNATRAVYLLIYGPLSFFFSGPVFTSHAGYLWASVRADGGVPPVTYSIASGQFPSGVILDQSGVISGGPQQGDYEFVVRVQDAASPPQVAEQPFALHILPPDITINWTSYITGRAGRPLSYQFSASAGTPPFKWKVNGSLPEGLTLSESGLLSGTATQDGYFDFRADVSDSANPVQTASTAATVMLSPLAPVPNDSIANATPIAFDEWSNSSVAVSISPYTDDRGVAAPDNDYFKFLAQGGSTVTVVANPYSNSYVGQSDSYADPIMELLDASGTRLKTCNNSADDEPPYSWIVPDPTPNGFDDDCVNDDGSYITLGAMLTLKVPDKSDTVQTIYAHVVDYRGDSRPDMTYSFGVSPLFRPLQMRSSVMPVGAVGRYYSSYPSVFGGVGGLTFGAGSALPPGLSMVGSTISGTPTTAGTYAVLLQVKDSANPPETDERIYQFTILPKLTFVLTSLPDGMLGVPYDAPVPVSGGGQVRLSLSPTEDWPCCIYMREDGHLVGTPRKAGSFKTWITAADESGQSAAQYVTLTIASAN